MASSQSKFYTLLGLMFVVGVAVIGFVAMRDRGGASAETAQPSSNAGASLGEPVSQEVGVSIGREDAPVLIEEYADFQCPYCGMVATLTVPQIIENYVQTGKARYVFYDFPLHPGVSQLGAEAARCAGDQNAFWPMKKVLFGRMREWGRERDPSRIFREYAEALGLDGKALAECVESQRHREVVLASQRRARQLGLNSTPTFFINGRRVEGAMGYDQMAALIEEELAKG